jgi:glutaredoxin-related protein
VFINGKCIGGGDEVKSLDSKGKLRDMLVEAGAI